MIRPPGHMGKIITVHLLQEVFALVTDFSSGKSTSESVAKKVPHVSEFALFLRREHFENSSHALVTFEDVLRETFGPLLRTQETVAD